MSGNRPPAPDPEPGADPPPSDPGGPSAGIHTFLIADIRGYTVFTQERGDEAAGELARAFARIARAGVEGRGGSVIELRGDEALAVFPSARQALRAAVELQATFAAETAAHAELPMRVGMGLDAGEAVPVETGYRGGALNLAARLCSAAAAGEVLASQEVVHLARKVDGLRFEDRGRIALKGLVEPVGVVRVAAGDAPVVPAAPRGRTRPGRRMRRMLVAGVGVAAVLAAVVVYLAGRPSGAAASPSGCEIAIGSLNDRSSTRPCSTASPAPWPSTAPRSAAPGRRTRLPPACGRCRPSFVAGAA